MTFTSSQRAGEPATPADRLRDIEAVTDAALSRLDERALLEALLDRVKKTLQADTAAVLLLDRSARQLVAAVASGIEDEVLQGTRVPFGTGFAGRVAAAGEPVILAEVSAATVSNPLLVDRGIKSLLGVPLFAGGKVIGVLHVGSLTGRRFTADDADLLQLAADRAALALRSLMAQDDALAAVALQNSLLPSTPPDVPGLELAARYVAGSGKVGGDWYDVFRLPGGRCGIAVGDVVGSGLQAAAIMGRMRSALRAYALETGDPATVLAKLDRKIQYFEPDAMATVLYASYHPPSGELLVSAAGHPPPVLAADGRPGAPLAIRPDPPVGAVDSPARHVTRLLIPRGGLLACYTDGLVERRDQPIDAGISALAAAMDTVLGSRASRGQRPVPLADDACAVAMRALVGSAAATDDVALLMAYRSPAG